MLKISNPSGKNIEKLCFDVVLERFEHFGPDVCVSNTVWKKMYNKKRSEQLDF